jgi:hypothetical protein
MARNSNADAAEIYLLIDGHGAAKIGISEQADKRIRRHRGQGWEVVARWPTSSREKALLVERTVLKWVRETNRSPAPYGSAFCPDGWSESINLHDVPLPELLKQIRLAAG